MLTSFDRDTRNDDRFDGPILRARRNALDVENDLLRCLVGHLTKNRVSALKVRSFDRGDEELRAIRARPGIRHGEQERSVERELWVNLITELVAGSAVTHTERVATLDHEVSNDAVEDDAVVQRGRRLVTRPGVRPLLLPSREADEVFDGDGSVISEQVDSDVPVIGVDGGNVGVNRHVTILPLPELLRDRALVDNESQGGVMSKKYKRELAELGSASNEALGSAGRIISDAARLAARYSRDEIEPRARREYADHIAPLIATGIAAGRRYLRDAPIRRAPAKSGLGSFITAGFAVAVVAGIAYVAWQTLRTDEGAWIDDEFEVD